MCLHLGEVVYKSAWRETNRQGQVAQVQARWAYGDAAPRGSRAGRQWQYTAGDGSTAALAGLITRPTRMPRFCGWDYVVLSVIGSGLCLWMAYRRKKSWARAPDDLD
jgi:hypothetical protein